MQGFVYWFGAFFKLLSRKDKLCYCSGGFEAWVNSTSCKSSPLSLQSTVGSNSWQMVNLDLPANSPRFALFDLVKGKSYCFRVRSANKYGISEPSLPSEPVTAGAKLGNYAINMLYTNNLEKETHCESNVWVPLPPFPLNLMVCDYTAVAALISGNLLKPKSLLNYSAVGQCSVNLTKQWWGNYI